ncbi:MAG: SDR family oxidoreductase [Pseudomonadota bacterium]
MPVSDFNNKVAAITGAGSGIGLGLAKTLAQRGCHLALADIDADRLASASSALADRVTVSTHVVDVADREQVEAFAAEVVASHGRVNLIFNNAGVTVADLAEHISYKDFEWLMGICFWGVVYGSKAFLPYLREQNGDAAIVNTSSIFGTVAVPRQSAYHAAKFGVRGFTYSMRQELAEANIGVSCVQPGGVKTNIARDARVVMRENDGPTREEMAARFEEVAGLTPEQAAEIILRGVSRNRAQILVGRDARVMAWLERLAPVGYQRLLQRFLRDPERDNPT